MRKWLVTFALTLAVAGVASAQKQDEIAKEMVPLQGTWVVSTVNGEAGQGGQIALTITGSKYSETVDGTLDETGLFKVDATKTPMTVDLVIETGNDGGKTQLGIFEQKGDTIRVLLNQAGAPNRPTSLEKGDGDLFVVAQRKK